VGAGAGGVVGVPPDGLDAAPSGALATAFESESPPHDTRQADIVASTRAWRIERDRTIPVSLRMGQRAVGITLFLQRVSCCPHVHCAQNLNASRVCKRFQEEAYAICIPRPLGRWRARDSTQLVAILERAVTAVTNSASPCRQYDKGKHGRMNRARVFDQARSRRSQPSLWEESGPAATENGRLCPASSG
jgi:hypothetical protein